MNGKNQKLKIVVLAAALAGGLLLTLYLTNSLTGLNFILFLPFLFLPFWWSHQGGAGRADQKPDYRPGIGPVKPRWPFVPYAMAFTGRGATREDVEEGRAIFSQEDETGAPGKQMNIELPQYAFWDCEEEGGQVPVVILQAESSNDKEMVGFISLDFKDKAVAMLDEMELLGTDPSA